MTININDFKLKITNYITDRLSNMEDGTIQQDILLDDYIANNSKTIIRAKRLKQIQMIIGDLWQVAVGLYPGYINIGSGHTCGLDVLHETNIRALELKNRYNTDNSSARKNNYKKLSEFKKQNPDCECIYGVANDTIKKGRRKEIIVDEQKIIYLSGDLLFTHIFGDDKELILNTMKNVVNEFVGSTSN